GSEWFKWRRMRLAEQAGRYGEGRACGRLRQTGQPKRAANTNGAPQYAPGEIGKTGELARTAGQHHTPARLRRKRRRGETVPHHFQDLLNTRPDDSHERSARDELRRLALVILDRWHRDHVAFIPAPGQNTAINRLDSLSVGNAGVKTSGQVHSHVMAA